MTVYGFTMTGTLRQLSKARERTTHHSRSADHIDCCGEVRVVVTISIRATGDIQRLSNDTIGQHGVSDLLETRDIGAPNIVDMVPA